MLSFCFALVFHKTTKLELPSPSAKIVFYANQARDDLKLLFCQAIRSTTQALFATFYATTDRDCISLLAKQAKLGREVTLQYDPSASLSLPSLFPPNASLHAHRSRGLMHRKILITDATHVYLGSANLTTSSLRHHSNFVLGLYSPSFANFLIHNESGFFSSTLEEQSIECYLLPDVERKALNRLLFLIEHSEHSIHIAMFTFTHPQITEALCSALNRGIAVQAVVDHHSGNGASKQAIEKLRHAGAQVHLSSGQQLLHHKWAIIDEKIFAMGSANWTKAAFTKNKDFLFILSPLTKKQRLFLIDLYRILELESL